MEAPLTPLVFVRRTRALYPDREAAVLVQRHIAWAAPRAARLESAVGNTDTQAAWEYHRRTNHSPASVRASGHWLDWANLPRPYKLSPTLAALPLPAERAESTLPALAAIASTGAARSAERAPTLGELSTVLHYSAGVTKRLRLPGGQMDFRAAACTGALYHIDLYLVCGELSGPAAGVYHYGPQDDALRLLRSGDLRGTLVEACAGQEWVERAPLSIVFTTTYWRNAWKYRERAYRHAFWDSGTILANMLALAAGHGLPSSVVMGFVDRDVNRLLDLDTRKEVALLVAPLGHAPNQVPPPAGPIGPLNLRTVPYSAAEGEYPAIRAIHAASSLSSVDAVRAWRRAGRALCVEGPAVTAAVRPLRPLAVDASPASIETTIRSRGSARRFQRTPISYEALSTILSCATQGVEADYRTEPGRALAECFLLVNAVEGLEPGAYRYVPGGDGLELLEPGGFRDLAGHLALDQELGADAAVNVYFLAQLPSMLEALGNRGYRATQLDASVMAGKMYLAAYALGLGATGLTFYDEQVTRFFGPRAADRSPMFLIALGNRAPRRARQGEGEKPDGLRILDPPGMLELLILLLGALHAALRGRADLVAENLLLRHQLAVPARPGRKRPRLRARDKLLQVLARRFCAGWRRHLVFVRPDTVGRWHRRGWRLVQWWQPRCPIGRPRLSSEVRELIATVSRENPLWSASSAM